MAKRMKQDNTDIVGEKCIHNDEGKLALSIDDKLKAWQSHYDNLLNEEFPWDANTLSNESPVEEPAIIISTEMVSKAISKMKAGKAVVHLALSLK